MALEVRWWLAAASLVACSDAAPPSHVTVELTSQNLGYATAADTSGWPVALCNVQVSASAAGDVKATFEAATFRWFWGFDRTKAVDSASFTAAEVVSHWEASEITPGEPLLSGWTISAPFPFEVEFEYSYRGEKATAASEVTTRVICGPTPPATKPEAPAVLNVAIAPSVGVREPGDTLRVNYEAVNTGGLWATVVATADAFDVDTVVAENLATSASRTVGLRIPPTATLGVPGVVGVFAFDAFDQYTGAGAQFSALGDETPPIIQVQQFTRPFGSLSPTLGGRYFVGDSIRFLIYAYDNYYIDSAFWEVAPAGYQDSVVASSPLYLTHDMKLPVRQEWLGNQQLRFYARDGAGLTSAVAASQPGAFGVYPSLARPIWSATIDARIDQVIVDTARNVAYLRRDFGEIFIFSLATRQIVRIIPMSALGMDITPGGDSLIVTTGGIQSERSFKVIDLRPSDPLVTTVPLTTSLDPALNQAARSVRVAKNGKAFAALEGNTTAAFRLLEFNLATGQQRLRTDGANGGLTGGPEGIARSIDHSVLVVNRGSCSQRYDSNTDSFGACGAILPTNGVPTADRSGQRFGHGVRVYDANIALQREVESAYNLTNAVPIATIDAAGEYLYHYLFPIGILRSRVADGQLLDRTLLTDFARVDAMHVSPDGKTLVLLQSGIPSRIGFVDLVSAPTVAAAAPAPPAPSARPQRNQQSPTVQVRHPTRGGARLRP